MWGWDLWGDMGQTHRCGAGVCGEMWGTDVAWDPQMWGRPTDVGRGSVEECGTHRFGMGPIDVGLEPTDVGQTHGCEAGIYGEMWGTDVGPGPTDVGRGAVGGDVGLGPTDVGLGSVGRCGAQMWGWGPQM